MSGTYYAVVHATCGHAAAMAPDRAGAERLNDLLALGGYHRFRVRALRDRAALEAAVTGLVASNGGACSTCAVDEERALALIAAGETR